MFTDRLFRIMENHARIDDALRRAEATANPNMQTIARLRRLKSRAKGVIADILRRHSQMTTLRT